MSPHENERYVERECWHGHDWWPIYQSETVEEQQCPMCGTIRFVGDRSRCMIFADER